jgi:hypothetical protein
MSFLRKTAAQKPDVSAGDPTAIAAELRRAGADPTVPHVTRHFMYVPGVKAAQQVARSVKSADRCVDIETSARRGFWLVVVSQSMLVTPENLTSVQAEFDSAARAVGGEYDRWQVDLAAG